MASAVVSESLPYSTDSRDWLLRVRPLGQAVWLDSARPHSQRGRYDIVSAAPLQTLDGRDCPDIFTDLQRAMDATFDPSVAPLPETQQVPFQGGAIGILDYETGRRLEGLAPHTTPDSRVSDTQFGLYSWAIVTDHEYRRCQLIMRPETPAALRIRIAECLHLQPAPPGSFALDSPWQEEFGYNAYAAAFARLRDYIQAGDCYQVNLARRLQARFSGDPLAAYLMLRERAAAPFSAYLENDHGAVLSLSPERLLEAAGRELFTQPIKGTAARAADPRLDRERAAQLLASSKNRSENLMIVDLLRNDLGRTCQPGSVRVEQLFELQSFATVHHLVSSIRGTLRTEFAPLDALRACFPGGSITGAPKHRAMQIIDELEPHPRQVFCGAIGYLSTCGRMDTSITIRTLLARRGELLAWAGGGIVADSDCEEEFEETRSKIGPLLDALQGL